MISENSVLRDYKIIQKLGEGGMGKVYLAEDIMLDRKVAIKVLNPILTQDEQFTTRFRQEAKVQASLVHSNIVTMHNFFLENNLYCMVMELAEGETLRNLIKRIGPIPEEKAMRIFNQLLEGVSFAHKKGVIHRDLKPSNIMIGDEDSVKIMDFGIAKIMGDRGLTRTGTKMGTVYYMSPEQIRAEKDIDHRTDIYSLGIVLYEMLTGKLPFNSDTESDFELMKEIVEKELKDPRELYPFISDFAISLVRKTTEKDKNKRYINVSDILADTSQKNIQTSNLSTEDSKKTTNQKHNDVIVENIKYNTKPQYERKTLDRSEIFSIGAIVFSLILIIIFTFRAPDSIKQDSGSYKTDEHIISKNEDLNNLEGKNKKDPEYYKGILEKANMKNDLGQYSEAIAEYETYLKEYPDDSDARIDMGVCYFNLKDFESAKKEMLKALEYSPKHQIGHLNLGVVALSSGNVADSKVWLQKAIEIDPTTVVAKRAEELLKYY